MSFQPTPIATVCECLPIAPFAPEPFSVAKLRTRFASVGLTCGMLPYRSKTRLLKLLGLTSLTVTV
jgi:hypothetical protein